MRQRLGLATLVVRDYDEAITYYTQRLGFALVEDTLLVPDEPKRWVVVAPKGAAGVGLLLARVSNEEQASRVGNQTGGRVAFFLHTDDFDRDYDAYKQRGVVFVSEPRSEPYGKVAVFADLYGNHWDLIELRP